MKKKVKSILFVGHESYRTGAAILLLNLIKWVYTYRKINLHLFLLDGGPLVEEYRKYAKVRIMSKKNSRFGIFRKIGLVFYLQKIKPDLIYFNTVISLKVYFRFKMLFSQFRKVLHIHEMPFSINELVGSNLNLEDFEMVLVVNKRIRDFISIQENITPKIFQITEYIDIKRLNQYHESSKNPNEIKIVLGVGVASWRKGFDYFLQTAAITLKIFPNQFRFVWIGPITNQERERANHDIQLMEIGHSFSLLPETSEISNFYKDADLFFLSSREDPFPLVMLEAAAFGLPVIYFQGTGGAEEFFNFKPFEVPYGDCQIASEKIKAILDNLNDYKGALNQFREKAFNCDKDLVVPNILKAIGLDE